jgi:hypothetical protein
MAGTPGDKISADYVRDQWLAQGLDYAELIDYDVLLDFPDDVKYNKFDKFLLLFHKSWIKLIVH